MNMNVVKGFRSKEIARWAKRHLSVNSHVVSDGLACFAAVKDAGCQHIGIVKGAFYSLRITQVRRSTAYRDGEFICLLTIASVKGV